MSFQSTRKYYEQQVIDCCTDAAVEYRPENTLEPSGDASHKFCLARLQFGEMMEQTLNCGFLNNRRAVFIVEYYGPKGVGPADAQDFMECILCRFSTLKGITSINGPDFTSLDDRPYFFSRISFGLQVLPLPPCPSYSLSAVTCDCIDTKFYVCGDILDPTDVSICDYTDPEVFPSGGTAEYDNAEVLNPEDVNKTLEKLAEENSCQLV